MSIIAGVFCRRTDGRVPPATKARLVHSLSRNPADRAELFEDCRCLLAKVDIGAYGVPAFYRGEAGSAAVLAGHPLGSGPHSRTNRSEQLRVLAQTWDEGDWQALIHTRGTFCAAHYNPREGTLALITDKVGVRGLYFWHDDEFVIFASALRVLEALASVPKRMDLRAAAEVMALGYPLADRTPYAGIVRLRPGEIALASGNSVSRSCYAKWESVATSSESVPKLVEQAYDCFLEAVEARCAGDTGIISFLSGGLDSRCIAGALAALKRNVWTWNFSLSASLNKTLARMYAEVSGAVHVEKPMSVEEPVVTSLARALDAGEPLPFPIERPRFVWSGDGGSVGLGHVYLDSSTVAFLKSRRLTEAIASFMTDVGASVPAGILRRELRKQLAALPAEGIREELARIQCDDPVRQFHIFLLNNDQRWHLSSVYEDLDIHHIEMELPFFDGALLALIVSLPADICLGHKFYHEWLRMFPPGTTAVPWQTYPGHEPCPLSLPAGLNNQWSAALEKRRRRMRRTRLLQAGRAVFTDFPVRVLDKRRLRAALLLQKAGIKDYTYMITAATRIHKFWVAANGSVAPLQ